MIKSLKSANILRNTNENPNNIKIRSINYCNSSHLLQEIYICYRFEYKLLFLWQFSS